jgi:hypothetical protein
MNRCRLPWASACLAMVFGALCACTSTTYKNTINPGYGDAKYKSDLAQCNQDNSKLVTREGYTPYTEVVVDQAKADSCMATHGWQAVSK